jgi:hypothetical protein
MQMDLDSDPEFQSLTKSISFPALELITALAKKRGVQTVPLYWQLFDYLRKRWLENKSCEGSEDGVY